MSSQDVWLDELKQKNYRDWTRDTFDAWPNVEIFSTDVQVFLSVILLPANKSHR